MRVIHSSIILPSTPERGASPVALLVIFLSMLACQVLVSRSFTRPSSIEQHHVLVSSSPPCQHFQVTNSSSSRETESGASRASTTPATGHLQVRALPRRCRPSITGSIASMAITNDERRSKVLPSTSPLHFAHPHRANKSLTASRSIVSGTFSQSIPLLSPPRPLPLQITVIIFLFLSHRTTR